MAAPEWAASSNSILIKKPACVVKRFSSWVSSSKRLIELRQARWKTRAQRVVNDCVYKVVRSDEKLTWEEWKSHSWLWFLMLCIFSSYSLGEGKKDGKRESRRVSQSSHVSRKKWIGIDNSRCAYTSTLLWFYQSLQLIGLLRRHVKCIVVLHRLPWNTQPK